MEHSFSCPGDSTLKTSAFPLRRACCAAVLSALALAPAHARHFYRLSSTGVQAPPTTAVLTIVAGDANFEAVQVGLSALQRMITVRNDGGDPVSPAAYVTGNSAEFRVQLAGCFELLPGATCTLKADFLPTAIGARPTATISLVGARNAPTLATSGTGLSIPLAFNGTARTWADGKYAANCLQYRTGYGNYAYIGDIGDGLYRIDPDGAGPVSAVDVTCDMNTDNGGWTQVYSGSPTASTTYPVFLSSATPGNVVTGTSLRFARQIAGTWYGSICPFPTGITSIASLATRNLSPYGSAPTTVRQASALYPAAYANTSANCTWMVYDTATGSTAITSNLIDSAAILTTDSRSNGSEIDYDYGVGQSEGYGSGVSGPALDGLGGTAPMKMWVR